jgi:hypothetical protein
MTERPANISLQRTASGGLAAAELRSLCGLGLLPAVIVAVSLGCARSPRPAGVHLLVRNASGSMLPRLRIVGWQRVRNHQRSLFEVTCPELEPGGVCRRAVIPAAPFELMVEEDDSRAPRLNGWGNALYPPTGCSVTVVVDTKRKLTFSMSLEPPSLASRSKEVAHHAA